MSTPKASSTPASISMEAGLPDIAPDFVEQEDSVSIDDPIPSRGYSMLPLVGLGGSAGSIKALQTFFSTMPPESGMAFVVILHLSPEHQSTMAQLLQRTTTMRVVQAKDLEKIEPNRVYVIPPGKYLSAVDEHLRLSPLHAARGKRVAVDLFFRTLADSHGPHAVAIVLSGADGDGAIGIKRIKERGGLTIAQDPAEAEHPSMPSTAIDTGMVDWVLPVQQMPHRLLKYRENERALQLPPEEGPPPLRPEALNEDRELALHEVMTFLRIRTKRDFSCYKRATILRRLARRMQVNGTLNLADYLNFLRTHPAETIALFKDLLISVTNFFRDRDCFKAMEALLPSLFEGKGPNDAVRIWVPACATGEEAYSLAILLCEYAERLPEAPMIQIFATDLDEEVIRVARNAVYPETISADVSEERRRRFFIKEEHGYRIRKELRELVLFAIHDVLKDSPFSRLDLISCRNLLIYLNRAAQARLIETFHFALHPQRWLFLGSSESIEEGSSLFEIRDKKHRIFQHRPATRASAPILSEASLLAHATPLPQPRMDGISFAGNSFQTVLRNAGAAMLPGMENEHRVSWSELHFKLLEQLAPPSVIVNQSHDIQHLSENAGRFLHFAGGEPTMNILRLVHPMLRIELRSALYRAKETGEPVEVAQVSMEENGTTYAVTLRVDPAKSLAPGFFLILFDARKEVDRVQTEATSLHSEPAWRHLERELEQMKMQLRDTVEQYEASTEELKASNEELQAMNEELRSATEELETSREELQSINEELVTVNSELKSNVDQLGHANSDMQNLMAATAIPTIFLDRDLCIMRYTPSAVKLFHLISSDIGRPLTDLKHQLDYPGMLADTTRVLAELVLIERHVGAAGGQWYLARVLPYRTTENQINGVVLTLVDITEQKRAAQALGESEERYRALTNASSHVLYRMSPDWSEMRQLQGDKLLALTRMPNSSWLKDYIHPADHESFRKAIRTAVSTKGVFEREHRVRRADGSWGWTFSRAVPMLDAAGEIIEWFGAASDVTERKRVEEALIQSEERLRRAFQIETVGVLFFDINGRITEANNAFLTMSGYNQADLNAGQISRDKMTPPEWMAQTATALEEFTTTGRTTPYEKEYLRKDGSRWWALFASTRLNPNEGVEFILDVTSRKHAEHALEASRQELITALQETEKARQEAEAAGRAKDHFLAILSHELRTPLTPVMMVGEMLLSRKDLSAYVRDGLETICRNVQLETLLIDDLLDVTKISNGKFEIQLLPFDLHEAVRRAIEITTPDIEAKNQCLSIDFGAKYSRVCGDVGRLQQVFWNLLKNASKFTAPKGDLRIASRNEQNAIVIEITDSGRGIDPETLSRIFQAFQQGDESVTREFGGLGLGLAISKATLDAHHGKLSASSDGLGQGSLFTVELPLVDAAE